MADFTGNNASETIQGTTSDDTITGLGGNDTLRGLDGNDTYFFNGAFGIYTIFDTTGVD